EKAPQKKISESGKITENNENCSSNKNESALTICRSNFTLNRTVFNQTGYFSCHYVNFPDYKDSLYIFINDAKNILIPNHENSILQIRSMLIKVPCKATYSSAELTLYRITNNTKNSYVRELVNSSSSFNFTFDPTEGFKFYQSVLIGIKQLEMNFECRASVHNRTAVSKLIVKLKSTDTYLEAGIVRSNVKNVFVNESLTLSCHVRFKLSENYPIFWMNWTYPASVIPSIREKQPNCSQNICNIEIQLKVNKVSSVHEGWYSCDVINTLANYTAKLFVPVFKRNTRQYFKFLTDFNRTELITKTIGEKIDFSIDVYSVKSVQHLAYRWIKDGSKTIDFINDDTFKAIENSNLNFKYQMNSMIYKEDDLNFKRAKLTFTVNSLTYNDSGAYTFVNAYDNITLTLQIQGPPNVKIVEMPTYFLFNHTYKLECDVTAYPLPKIVWEFMPCTPNAGVCNVAANTSFTELEPNHLQLVPLVNNHYRLKGDIKANYSSIYRCRASNVRGNSSEKHLIIVSDASENGFTMNISTRSPFEYEKVIITCKSSLFNYPVITWRWKSALTNKSIELSKHFTFNKSRSNYSLISQLEIRNVSINNSGIYSCEFEKPVKVGKKIVKQKESLGVTLDVIAIEKPKIIDTNLNGLQLSVTPQEFIEFHCNSTGIPKPSIVWLKDKKILNSTKRSAINIENDGNSLSIQKLAQSDSGLYECVVNNIAGTVRQNITLVVEEMSSSSNFKTIIIVVTTALCVSFLFMISFYILKRRKVKQSTKKRFKFSTEMNVVIRKHTVWEFSKDRLKLLKMIGEGSFGIVYLAEAIGLSKNELSTQVAVKTVKDANDQMQQKLLLEEFKIFTNLGNHVNIVNLLGIVTKDMPKGQIFLIVEYCEFGNLRSYLQSRRKNFINALNECNTNQTQQEERQQVQKNEKMFDSGYAANTDSKETIMTAAFKDCSSETQKCDNLNYCSSKHSAQKCDKIVEPNCIAQFSYSFSNDTKESSSEAKNLKSYSSSANQSPATMSSAANVCESDETCYVTINHLYSFAFQIAKGMHYLATRQNGYRMSKPDYCSNEIYDIMKSCWHNDPEKRPDFARLTDLFFEYLDWSTKDYYLQLESG
ncbi:Vascular endothelial growth factor receptor 3-like protein, partial [Dinothrombium tinctorium]